MNVNSKDIFYIKYENNVIMSVTAYEENLGLSIYFKYLNSSNINLQFDTTQKHFDLSRFPYKRTNGDFFHLNHEMRELGYKSSIFIHKYKRDDSNSKKMKYIEIKLLLPLFSKPSKNDSIVLLTNNIFSYKGKNILPDSLLFTYQNKVN